MRLPLLPVLQQERLASPWKRAGAPPVLALDLPPLPSQQDGAAKKALEEADLEISAALEGARVAFSGDERPPRSSRSWRPAPKRAFAGLRSASASRGARTHPTARSRSECPEQDPRSRQTRAVELQELLLCGGQAVTGAEIVRGDWLPGEISEQQALQTTQALHRRSVMKKLGHEERLHAREERTRQYFREANQVRAHRNAMADQDAETELVMASDERALTRTRRRRNAVALSFAWSNWLEDEQESGGEEQRSVVAELNSKFQSLRARIGGESVTPCDGP